MADPLNPSPEFFMTFDELIDELQQCGSLNSLLIHLGRQSLLDDLSPEQIADAAHIAGVINARQRRNVRRTLRKDQIKSEGRYKNDGPNGNAIAAPPL